MSQSQMPMACGAHCGTPGNCSPYCYYYNYGGGPIQIVDNPPPCYPPSHCPPHCPPQYPPPCHPQYPPSCCPNCPNNPSNYGHNCACHQTR
ncbi:hypothetical protein ABMA28_002694 [Loxostege sticticalis]|uniref:Uncharacterized protein n=1 Tax=Loxostege sticticalis TaxID=481309 RepID=A0ABD0SY13_LOXSC